MAVIGIIGGGQLGMFLCIEAFHLGYDVLIYDVDKNCSASHVTNNFINGSFDDEDKLMEFASKCDYITYEFENINFDIMIKIQSKYNVVQDLSILRIAQNRLLEKEMANKLGINIGKYHHLKSEDDFDVIINKMTFPLIIKTLSLGYDGKGQSIINNENELMNFEIDGKTYLVEEMIAFDYELSIIACMNKDELVIYEPFYNIHKYGILRYTIINLVLDDELVSALNDVVTKVMKTYQITGLLCLEFFIKDNVYYFNELAPRPHNSGHITLDTHITNQYTNHIKAVVGQPLGKVSIKCDGLMYNLIGFDNPCFSKDTIGNSKYYHYHKDARINRKVGHINILNTKDIKELI